MDQYYQLIISTEKQGKRKSEKMKDEIYFCDDHGTPVKGDGLFIVSGIMQPFLVRYWSGKTDEQSLWDALKQASNTITGEEFIKEAPIPINEIWEPFISLACQSNFGSEDINKIATRILLEVDALVYAVYFWLSPCKNKDDCNYWPSSVLIAGDSLSGVFDYVGKKIKKNNGLPAIDIDQPVSFVDTNMNTNMHAFVSYCLNARARQVVTAPSITKDETMIRTYESNGLLPLAWMEIWHALEHNIKYKVCPYCGRVFTPSPFHPQTKHCNGKDCRRINLITEKGGIDGYKEWEKERKRAYRNSNADK
jgi:hypothetical protein